MTQQKTDYPLDYGKNTGEAANDRLRMSETATDKFKEVRDNAQEIAGQMVEQAREYGEKARAATKEFKPFVEKSLKEQPMTTLAGAALIGFVLGALWKK
jgi:ElaB/YqjD/DUF883 family membrane-anchored ribosome-binding protein